MKKKTLALFLVLALAFGGVIGGTVAWLTDTSEPVVNTFTDSDIDITLTESTGTEYEMVPGYTISKDPKVTVEAGSEKCYLFVKLDESDNFDSFLTYEIAEGWEQLKDAENKDVNGVYYRVVDATTADVTFSVLKGDQVMVQGRVTKEMMNNLTTENYPKLTVTAYASQYQKNNNASDNAFTPNEAWTNIFPSSTN